MSERLPLFPLGTVLFPGLVLPLHVFETRYRRLVRDLMDAHDGKYGEFGVVAIRRGWEVERDPQAGSPLSAGTSLTLYEVGCTAEIRQLTEHPDGRYDLVTVGRRRFRVLRVRRSETPYLTAEVGWLPDDTSEPMLAADLAGRVHVAFQRYLQLMRRDAEIGEQLPDDPTVLSHLVAATASLTLDDRQRLLAEPNTVSRLRAELSVLRREAGLLQRVRAVPVPLTELAVPSSPN
jgi:Lon protease-like protein